MLEKYELWFQCNISSLVMKKLFLLVVLSGKYFSIQTYGFAEINVSGGQLLMMFYSLIKTFVQILLSSNLRLFGKEICHHNFIEAVEKLKFRFTFSKESIWHETLPKFFSEPCSNALKDFFSQSFSDIQL